MKTLQNMTFEDLVKMGIEIELDAVVVGTKLKNRVYQIMDLACRWQYEQNKKEKSD